MIKSSTGKITLDKCPYCGATEYYEKIFMKGMVVHKYAFSDHKTLLNKNDLDRYKDLYEVYKANYIYCAGCNKRLCKKEDLNE